MDPDFVQNSVGLGGKSTAHGTSCVALDKHCHLSALFSLHYGLPRKGLNRKKAKLLGH